MQGIRFRQEQGVCSVLIPFRCNEQACKGHHKRQQQQQPLEAAEKVSAWCAKLYMFTPQNSFGMTACCVGECFTGRESATDASGAARLWQQLHASVAG